MSESTVKAETAARLRASPRKHSHFLLRLGPGLITGAADDDPSGIATYSQVGAQFGMGMLWTMLFSFPLMAAMQEICGRLGRITGAGIAENLRKNYPKPVLYGLVSLFCVANIFNLGADVTAMGAAAQLVFGGSLNVYVLVFGLLSLYLVVYVPYKKYVHYLKWLTLALFAYVATAFVVHVPWKMALRSTVIPSVTWTADYWMALVAVLGTTISPYLFFWQTSEEAEDVRLKRDESPLKTRPEQALPEFRRISLDTWVGMGFSNLVAFFIILTTAVTLHVASAGKPIETAAEAAKALQPLAGHFAFLLFALGIIGTGLLAIPVLAGSAAYAVAEAFRWRASLEMQTAPGAEVLCGAGGSDDHRNRTEFSGDEPDTRAVLVRGDQRRGGGSADGYADDHVRERRHRKGVFASAVSPYRRLGRDGGNAAGFAGIYREQHPRIVLTPA